MRNPFKEFGAKKVWATGTEAWTQGGGEMHGLVIGGAV